MPLLHALILGIIEGITEFLPISSTGHLILASSLFKIPATNFQKSFEIIIQLGAIASVIVLYRRTFFDIATIKKLVVAFIPTGIIGFALYRLIKMYLLGNEYVVLLALFLGGIALIAFEMWHTEPKENTAGLSAISYKSALLIGLCQSVAIIPGVSRSAATIVGGLLLNIPRKKIVEFSFLMAVPTMLAASGLDVLKSASSFSTDQFSVLAVGFISSFMVAIVSIKFLLAFIQKRNFIPFGIYRIAIAIFFWIFIVW